MISYHSFHNFFMFHFTFILFLARAYFFVRKPQEWHVKLDHEFLLDSLKVLCQ